MATVLSRAPTSTFGLWVIRSPPACSFPFMSALRTGAHFSCATLARVHRFFRGDVGSCEATGSQ